MKLTYKTYAESAVKAEKKGNSLEAAKNWANAKRNTAVKKNIEYCQRRIDFCERHHFRLKSMSQEQTNETFR